MQNDHLDEHIKILSQKKPNIDNDWLQQQRNRLVGVIDQYEHKPKASFPILYKYFQFSSFSKIYQIAASILILLTGIAIGTKLDYNNNMENIDSASSISNLLNNHRISSVQLNIDDEDSNPFKFNLVANKPIEYSGNEHDENVVLLLNHMLNNTNNPGERLKLAKKLSDTELKGELFAKVITKAIFNEDNSAIQKILIESIKHNQSSTVRDALLRIVMGQYDPHIRLSAIKLLAHFSNDAYVIKMLKIISISDDNPSIRFTASKIISHKENNSLNTDEIEK
ncbi:MAG: HEAT repeat domain-containing protein [Candidatus Marinimicrobia bacterium]|jgi:hypothetical protein|nr:HEAT repeat domain-containing protein [Candidatus Neomarinimicrobiota bacterium]MBT3633937.1 HEAT repeat domain-containing protein [Candidatus Neomarinimicrobiota bacterium]MBT3682814.1 HEAT repeat domain-containing protein [Candidatus Neomarinimicrobiota bacterium]MBT3759999.1 HEAT repeat domain-containing protein [Candidatus Neomarinimicrobiota bacterium]MBT3896093.1 HEAT repeat domain-containing protein [Candidatus Neomarinimicrobiota bacterium]